MSTPPIPVSGDPAPVVDINSPVDTIRNAYMAQQTATPAPVAAEPPTPEPTPAPVVEEEYNIRELPDGRKHLKLKGGEEFFGKDEREVLIKVAKSKDETAAWAKGLKGELEGIRSAIPKAPEPAPVQLTDEQKAQADADEFIANAMARKMGYSNYQEMQEELGLMRQSSLAVKQDQITTNFLAHNPDFPNTEAAAKEMFTIADEMCKQYGIKEIDANLLGLAHAQAIRMKKYSPLTDEQQRIATNGIPPANRPVPTPPLPTASPESAVAAQTQLDINSSQKDLRAAYLAELAKQKR